jgi:hypothetical protein
MPPRTACCSSTTRLLSAWVQCPPSSCTVLAALLPDPPFLGLPDHSHHPDPNHELISAWAPTFLVPLRGDSCRTCLFHLQPPLAALHHCALDCLECVQGCLPLSRFVLICECWRLTGSVPPIATVLTSFVDLGLLPLAQASCGKHSPPICIEFLCLLAHPLGLEITMVLRSMSRYTCADEVLIPRFPPCVAFV